MKEDLSKKITGLMFAYSLICPRKLWYYAKGITLEDTSEYVNLGKLIDENTFKREDKHILINDCINIDYMKNGIVYEIKKSKSLKEASEYQIKYYLYNLYENGIENPVGILKIPKEKYEQEIYLTKDDISFIENKLKEIRKIIESNIVPTKINSSICKKCAYYELCEI